jgi:hypothetical protein
MGEAFWGVVIPWAKELLELYEQGTPRERWKWQHRFERMMRRATDWGSLSRALAQSPISRENG